MVVQLFKKIDMRRTEFVQLCKKLYILAQIPLQINFRPNHSISKLYNFFLWLYSFLKILIWGRKNLYSFVKKLYILVQMPLPNEFKTKAQCAKDVQLFSLVVQLSNCCTAF